MTVPSVVNATGFARWIFRSANILNRVAAFYLRSVSFARPVLTSALPMHSSGRLSAIWVGKSICGKESRRLRIRKPGMKLSTVIEIEPELSACIETKAKNEYQRTLRELLKKDKDDRLEERLETLRLFLEGTDFKELREKYEVYLTQGKRVKFHIYLDAGILKYEIAVL